LNNSLKSQRSPIDKTRIGYKKEHTVVEQKFTSLEKKIDGRPQSVAPNLRKVNEENSKKNDYFQIRDENQGLRRTSPHRRRRNPRYKGIFFGNFYSCHNFGHKATYCRVYGRNVPNKNKDMTNSNIKFYNFYNYGHIARYCDMKKTHRPRLTKVWRRKSEVRNKKYEEDMAPKIDEAGNIRMMGEVPNKECENQSLAYKVDQAQ